MNAKRIVLFAVVVLALTAFAPAARAAVAPIESHPYYCYFYNPDGSFNNGLSGFSVFRWTYQNAPTIKRGIEEYWLNNGTHDNRKVDFFYTGPGPNGSSIWEFTIKYGPQCKSTVVSSTARTISFGACTDGHTRFCSW